MPTRPWIVATIVTVIVAVLGAFLLASAIDNDEQTTFDAAVEVFQGEIADQASSYAAIGFIMPAVLGSEALSIEQLLGFLGEEDGGSFMVGALPVEGFAGLGFLVSDGAGSYQPLMLPNSRGITDDTLLDPVLVAVANEVLDSGRSAVSDPLTDGSPAAYVYAVPVTSGTVVLEFIDVSELLESAATNSGVRMLEAVATDVATGEVVGESASVPGGAEPNQELSWSLVGRKLSLEVHVGEGFSWAPSWIPALSMIGFGLAIAALIWIVGVVSRRRDLEHRKQLQMAEQMIYERDRFVAAVSHELRTPLTAVVGFASELSHSFDTFSREEVREFVSLVAQESRDVALLVEDLLVAAQIENETVGIITDTIEVDGLVSEVLAGLGGDGSRVSATPSGVWAWADPLRVRQVLRNLLVNAMRHGGDQTVLHSESDGVTTTIEVRDDGPPIAPATRERMFDTYYHAATDPGVAPSVGLGLSVSRVLSRMMGGDLTYRHEDGWGCFRLTLPAGHPDPPRSVPPNPGRDQESTLEAVLGA